MARHILSAKGLDSAWKSAALEAAAKNTRVKVSDGDNLLLIVRPGGGASWVLNYRVAGLRKNVTLGAFPSVGLKTARDLADEAREKVARGIDPAAERAAAVAAATEAKLAEVHNFRAVYLVWLGKLRVSEVYRGNIAAAMTRDVLPAIGAMPVAAVKRSDIIEILRGMEARGALQMLRRVRMWLKQVYEYALDAELVQSSPVPTQQLKSFLRPTEGHHPAITDPAAVPKLMRAIRAYAHPVTRAALLLAAYTWQRPTEVREADWREFDLEAARWVIPAERMKLSREHWVPLPSQVVALLRAYQGVVGGTGWVFPGRVSGKPLSEGAMLMALKHMGFSGIHTPHGFRAMGRTIGEELLGFPHKVAEKHLAHTEPDKVQRAYNRAEYWPERIAMAQAWADWLDVQGKEAPGGQHPVITL